MWERGAGKCSRSSDEGVRLKIYLYKLAANFIEQLLLRPEASFRERLSPDIIHFILLCHPVSQAALTLYR